MSKRKQLASAVKPKGGAKFAKKGAVKEQEESPAPSGSEEGSETEESEADVEDDSEPQEQNDGLADMMSKILNQNIGSKVIHPDHQLQCPTAGLNFEQFLHRYQCWRRGRPP